MGQNLGRRVSLAGIDNMNDLYLEHDFHYSDDWENLKDKCSSCFGAIQNSKRSKDVLREQLGSFERSDEITRETQSNPLE
jgi:hypothetical protein